MSHKSVFIGVQLLLAPCMDGARRAPYQYSVLIVFGRSPDRRKYGLWLGERILFLRRTRYYTISKTFSLLENPETRRTREKGTLQCAASASAIAMVALPSRAGALTAIMKWESSMGVTVSFFEEGFAFTKIFMRLFSVPPCFVSRAAVIPTSVFY